MNLNYILGVYSFTIGCLSFTFDAISNNIQPYLCGCILFDIGCVFFILDAHEIKLIKKFFMKFLLIVFTLFAN